MEVLLAFLNFSGTMANLDLVFSQVQVPHQSGAGVALAHHIRMFFSDRICESNDVLNSLRQRRKSSSTYDLWGVCAAWVRVARAITSHPRPCPFSQVMPWWCEFRVSFVSKIWALWTYVWFASFCDSVGLCFGHFGPKEISAKKTPMFFPTQCTNPCTFDLSTFKYSFIQK